MNQQQQRIAEPVTGADSLTLRLSFSFAEKYINPNA
jgi:hypothetical protein